MPGSVLGAIAAELAMWVSEAVRFLPGRTGFALRRMYWHRHLAALGEHSRFEIGTMVICGNNISIGSRFSMMRNSAIFACDGTIQIGDRVSINSNVTIDASDRGRIVIGNDVLIGPNVVLRASNHVYNAKDRPINQQGHAGGNIIVQDDVWIGANVVITPDVTIGAHSVVAAGAVVTHVVEPWTLVGGVPARLISRR